MHRFSLLAVLYEYSLMSFYKFIALSQSFNLVCLRIVAFANCILYQSHVNLAQMVNFIIIIRIRNKTKYLLEGGLLIWAHGVAGLGL